MKLLTDRLDGKDVPESVLQEDARRYAENRCLRTWRGVSHLAVPGICSNKDACYLQGFLAVCHAVGEDAIVFDRLMVGMIGLHHLQEMVELGIVKSGIEHRRLATDPDLDAYISRFVDIAESGEAKH